MSERFSRRKFLKAATLPAAAFVMSKIPEANRETIDLSRYKAGTIAHNAALYPEKFQAALRSHAPYIEVDLTKANGQLVVAHEPSSYLALHENMQALQNPHRILRDIRRAGKYPFLDLKDEITDIAEVEEIVEDIASPYTMASSNNHDVLLALRDADFDGAIFFSIGSPQALRDFFITRGSNDFSEGSFGVSLRYSLLSLPNAARDLKNMGLSIAAWSPYTPETVAASIQQGADIITSDNFDLLGKIGRKD